MNVWEKEGTELTEHARVNHCAMTMVPWLTSSGTSQVNWYALRYTNRGDAVLKSLYCINHTVVTGHCIHNIKHLHPIPDHETHSEERRRQSRIDSEFSTGSLKTGMYTNTHTDSTPTPAITSHDNLKTCWPSKSRQTHSDNDRVKRSLSSRAACLACRPSSTPSGLVPFPLSCVSVM